VDRGCHEKGSRENREVTAGARPHTGQIHLSGLMLTATKITVRTLCVLAMLAGQQRAPDRTVIGSTIISSHDPQVRIQLPKSVEYVGADRWILYDIADCELHAFVKTDPQKQVQHLYWVQFEAYLPSKPDLHHTYDSIRHTTIGGLDFYVDTWVRAAAEKPAPGSDLEHINALITKKGFNLPSGMMYVRLVHLLDEQKRKELMIIYGESLENTGFTAADLDKGGKSYDRWLELQPGLIERARTKVQISESSANR
jgi:hypothetical protein